MREVIDVNLEGLTEKNDITSDTNNRNCIADIK